MSPAMKKPERVEVGQWWAWCNQRGPKRIETIRMYSGRLEAEYGNGHGSVVCQWLIENGEYLGSGDHPEPSEWMIEQLARVGSRNRRGINEGAALSERDPQYQDDLRSMARSAIEGAFSLAGPSITELVMLETYSILRSLGKW